MVIMLALLGSKLLMLLDLSLVLPLARCLSYWILASSLVPEIRARRPASSLVYQAMTNKARELCPDSFKRATFLDELASSYHDDFNDLMEGRPLAMQGQAGLLGTHNNVNITWGSMCSGTEVVLFALDAVRKSYGSRGISVTFEHKYSCELNCKKQTWIRGVFEHTDTPEGCLFKDWTQ